MRYFNLPKPSKSRATSLNTIDYAIDHVMVFTPNFEKFTKYAYS